MPHNHTPVVFIGENSTFFSSHMGELFSCFKSHKSLGNDYHKDDFIS